MADKVEDDKVVIVQFSVTDEKGTLLDEAPADDPLAYLHGNDNIVPGLEEALDGLAVGDTFNVTVSPEDGFGAALEDAERVIPREEFPEDLELIAGFEFAVEEDGEEIPLWVIKADDTRVVASLNHPFAGKTLTFDGKILRVREPTPDEIEHGHPHGADGDQGHDHD